MCLYLCISVCVCVCVIVYVVVVVVVVAVVVLQSVCAEELNLCVFGKGKKEIGTGNGRDLAAYI